MLCSASRLWAHCHGEFSPGPAFGHLWVLIESPGWVCYTDWALVTWLAVRETGKVFAFITGGRLCLPPRHLGREKFRDWQSKIKMNVYFDQNKSSCNSRTYTRNWHLPVKTWQRPSSIWGKERGLRKHERKSCWYPSCLNTSQPIC